MTGSSGESSAGRDRGDIETGDLRAALFTGADIGAKLGERGAWKLVVITVLAAWLAFLTISMVVFALLVDMPCKGCFESLKWDVDDLKAIHRNGENDEPRQDSEPDETRD